MSIGKVNNLLSYCERNARPTEDKKDRIDAIARAYHINKDWLYLGVGKMMTDNKRLTKTEVYLTALGTKAERATFLERFKKSMNMKGKDRFDLADMSKQSFQTIAKYFQGFVERFGENSRRPKDFVDVARVYCKQCGVNPDWLFYGKGHPEAGTEEEEPEPEAVRIEVGKKYKKWYLVNRTEVHYDGWRIIPNGFQIKRAYSAIEVAKNYPPKRVTVGKYVDDIIRSERAIGSYRTKADALAALSKEKRRIKRDGTDAWIAPWAKEVIR